MALRKIISYKLLGIPLGLLLIAVLAVGALATTGGWFVSDFDNAITLSAPPPANVAATYSIDQSQPQAVPTTGTVTWPSYAAGTQRNSTMTLAFSNTGGTSATQTITLPVLPTGFTMTPSATSFSVPAGGNTQVTITLGIASSVAEGTYDLGHILIGGSSP